MTRLRKEEMLLEILRLNGCADEADKAAGSCSTSALAASLGPPDAWGPPLRRDASERSPFLPFVLRWALIEQPKLS